jgi:hypothetical protein
VNLVLYHNKLYKNHINEALLIKWIEKLDMKHSPIYEGVEKLMQVISKNGHSSLQTPNISILKPPYIDYNPLL